MAKEIKNIVIRRLEEDGLFHIYYPQTTAAGLQDKDINATGHYNDESIHLKPEERANVLNKGIILDSKGMIPDNMIGSKGTGLRDYANFTELDMAMDLKSGEMVMVMDASDNPKADARHTGWEIVRVEGSPRAKEYSTVSKAQLMDYVAQVEHVNGIYNSQHADVDAMVAKDHTHANLEVLNGLTEEKIAKLAKKQDNTIIKYGENADKLENKEGDIVYNVTGVIN